MMNRILLLMILSSFLYFSDVETISFKITNRCRNTIWPGLLSGANSAPLPTTGFRLTRGKSKTVAIPNSWSGRLWARTLCSQDRSSGSFICLTGDCGSGKVECSGSGAKPPATLAEFTLNGTGGLDFYDVSLVDGYNLPILILPKKVVVGGCGATGCLVDLNAACPRELKLVERGKREGVACRSACEAFGDPRYCCSDAYATPDTCHPSVYSLFFKHACPRAYSYAYDDKTSTYTCSTGANYAIIFCPPPYTSYHLLSSTVYKLEAVRIKERWSSTAFSKQEHDSFTTSPHHLMFTPTLVIISLKSYSFFQADSTFMSRHSLLR